jgi:hypothetical protein
MVASTNRHQLGAEIFSERRKKKQRLKPEHFIGLERWGRVQERGGEVDPARHP